MESERARESGREKANEESVVGARKKERKCVKDTLQ